MILVVGATGLLGRRVCERLRAEGRPVRALVRRTSNPDKVNALRSLGCELVTGDPKDFPQIQAACQGISALISTASSTLSRQPGASIESVDLQGQLGLANAARSEGVATSAQNRSTYYGWIKKWRKNPEKLCGRA